MFTGTSFEAKDKRSSIRYRWAILTRGYMLTGCTSTDIDPSDDSFLRVFVDAAQAQADRDGIPFDAFYSDIRIVPE